MTDYKISRLVETFLDQVQGSFNIEQFADWAVEQGSPIQYETELDRVTSFLLAAGYLTADFITYERDIDRFRGMELVVSLTPFEKENGVLVPGHRFLPLVDTGNGPWTVTLIGPGGREIPKKTVEMTLDSFLIYVKLLGFENIPLYLQSDQGQGEGEDTSVKITVFDISAFLRETGYNPGDSLLLTAIDAPKRTFEIRKRALEAYPDSKTIRQFVKELDKAFARVFEAFGTAVDLPLQIALALYAAGPDIAIKPPIHLGGYLELSSRVRIMDFHETSILWNGKPSGHEAPIDTLGMLDGHLAIQDIPFTEAEIEAYMRHELFTRREDFGKVLEQVVGERELTFDDDEEKLEFDGLLEELWEEVKANYNYFSDQQRGPLRSRLIEILNAQVRFIKKVNAPHLHSDDLPDEFFDFSELSLHVALFLKMLNDETPLSQEDTAKMADKVDELDAAITALMTQVETAISSVPKKGKKAPQKHKH